MALKMIFEKPPLKPPPRETENWLFSRISKIALLGVFVAMFQHIHPYLSDKRFTPHHGLPPIICPGRKNEGRGGSLPAYRYQS